jgi:hypothetical protein
MWQVSAWYWKWYKTNLSLILPHVLSPVFGPAFTPYPSLSMWHQQNNEILLSLSVKCWNSTFNAQGSRLIKVVVQKRAVKIHVAALQALRKEERQDETHFTTKIGGKTRLGPSYFVL